jgi:Tfp pilus assembly protein PilF
MPEQIIQLDIKRPLVRIASIIIVALALVWGYFVVKWYLGNTIAEYFNQDEVSAVDMAKLAVDLAPADPLTHWRLGEINEKRLPPDQIAQAVREYEKAVSLSPNDYRFWMSLGRALEQAGEIEKGEVALRRAVALAPSYSFPHWFLGNLLLRSGRYDEAFPELQRASEADPELRPQLFNLAWEIFKSDQEMLKTSVGKSSEARAQFALYLMGRGRFEDGLNLWASLSEDDKVRNRSTALDIITSLVSVHRYHEAVEVWNVVAPGPNYRATSGQFIDGGFESGVAHGSSAAFSWQVQSQPQAQVAIDPQVGHNGARSLRLSFQVRSKLDSINVSQLVPVEPNTEYDFECYVKTSKLESGGTPFISLADATDGAVLVNSAAAPTGNNNWEQLPLTFKTGPKTEAIILRINRATCGEEPVCPIFGTIWYDDFNLKRRN